MFSIDNVHDLQKLIVNQAAEIVRLTVECNKQKSLTDFWMKLSAEKNSEREEIDFNNELLEDE